MPTSLFNPTVELFPTRTGVAAEQISSRAEAAVLALFDTLRASLLRYAISFGLSVDDAEDVLQETFLALFHHLQQGRSRSNLRGWLFCVTHNLAIKRRILTQRRRRVYGGDFDLAEDTSDPSLTPEENVLFSERQQRLQAVLRALPDRDRSCLQLRAEGLRYREIAKVTGISLGSVATSLTRSLARLSRTEGR